MAGKQPDFRAVTKIGEKRWRELGAAWGRDDGKLSVQLTTAPIPAKGKINFLLVPNELSKIDAE